MLSDFSHELFGVIPFSNQGEMLPNFSRQNFWGHSKHQIFYLVQGEMLPNFSPCTFWGDSSYQSRGKCCPFFPTNFLGVTQCIKSCVWNRGKCCRILPHELVGVIRVIKSGGNALQFFPRAFWGDSIFPIRAKCCPIFLD